MEDPQRHLKAVAASLLAVGLLISAQPASAAQRLAIGATLDPPLAAAPGQLVYAGYHFSVAASHPAAWMRIVGARIGFLAICMDGTTATVMTEIPDAGLEIEAGSSDWVPTMSGDTGGGERDMNVYQAALSAPDVCRGQPYVARQSMLQLGDVESTDTIDLVRVRFHLINATTTPALNGPWSPIATLRPSALRPMSTFTPTPTTASTPTPGGR